MGERKRERERVPFTCRYLIARRSFTVFLPYRRFTVARLYLSSCQPLLPWQRLIWQRPERLTQLSDDLSSRWHCCCPRVLLLLFLVAANWLFIVSVVCKDDDDDDENSIGIRHYRRIPAIICCKLDVTLCGYLFECSLGPLIIIIASLDRRNCSLSLSLSLPLTNVVLLFRANCCLAT